MGFGQPTAVVVMYVVGVGLAALALLSLLLTAREAGFLLGGLLIAGFVAVRRLGYEEFAVVRSGLVLQLFDAPVLKRSLFTVFVDLGLVGLATWGAMALKYDDWLLIDHRATAAAMVSVLLPSTVLALWGLKVYRGSWRVASVYDLVRLGGAIAGSSGAAYFVLQWTSREQAPASELTIYAMVMLLLAAGSRLSFRVLDESRQRKNLHGDPVLIVRCRHRRGKCVARNAVEPGSRHAGRWILGRRRLSEGKGRWRRADRWVLRRTGARCPVLRRASSRRVVSAHSGLSGDGGRAHLRAVGGPTSSDGDPIRPSRRASIRWVRCRAEVGRSTWSCRMSRATSRAARYRYYLAKLKQAYRSRSLSLKLRTKVLQAVYVPLSVMHDYWLDLTPQERHLDFERGFQDHSSLCKTPAPSTLQRLILAYKHARRQEPPGSCFAPRGLWQEWIGLNYRPLVGAIERGDLETLSALLVNFNREQMAVGTGAGYDDLVRYRRPWLGRTYVRTVWCRYRRLLASSGVDPDTVACPMIGNPAGPLIRGRAIPSETLRHAYKAHQIVSILSPRLANTVMEIGAGFGGCGYEVMRGQSQAVARYLLFDIPEVAFISGYFLIEALPDRLVRLAGEGPVNATDYTIGVFPHYSIEELPDRSVDLVFNSNSFSEMDCRTSGAYIRVVERVCRRYIFHVNHDTRLAFHNDSEGWSVNTVGSELYPTVLNSNPYSSDRARSDDRRTSSSQRTSSSTNGGRRRIGLRRRTPLPKLEGHHTASTSSSPTV